MPSPLVRVSAVPRPWPFFFFFPVVLLVICFLLCDSINGAEANNKTVMNMGIIIDVNTRVGKEEKTAMEIAVQNYNTNSKSHQVLSLHYRDALRVTSAGMLYISIIFLVFSGQVVRVNTIIHTSICDMLYFYLILSSC